MLRIITWPPACQVDRKLDGATDSSHACSFGRLFRACGFRPRPPCAVHLVGNLRRLCDALSAGASVATHRFTSLGNSHGTAALAVSFDALGELAGAKCGRRPVSGRLPAALSRQTGLPGCFCHRIDRRWRDRLCLQPGALREAGVENAALIAERLS